MALVLSDVQCILNVPPSWSFVNGLLNHVVKELNVEEALKSSILVVHKAAAVPLSWSFLNGLLNHVGDVVRGLRISTNQRPRNLSTQIHTQRIDILSGPALGAAPAKIEFKKIINWLHFEKIEIEKIIGWLHFENIEIKRIIN